MTVKHIYVKLDTVTSDHGESVVWTTSVLLIVLVMVASSVEATRTLDDDAAGARHDEDHRRPQVLTTVKDEACAVLGLPCGRETLQCRAGNQECERDGDCCSGKCRDMFPETSYCVGECRKNYSDCRSDSECCSGVCYKQKYASTGDCVTPPLPKPCVPKFGECGAGRGDCCIQHWGYNCNPHTGRCDY
ncbi:hypothetical protein M758_9G170900 [Ceratodon purpureus]|nr:hypothetical protein M758_9G170900 [Ceratodon purpureus]